MQVAQEPSEVEIQFTQPQQAQQAYQLRHDKYTLPPAQPGFVVQHDQATPYTFEPVHFDQYYHDTQRYPAYHTEPYTNISSKSQPAVALMTSAEYQHVGVSEAELAEMWAMLEDDNAPVSQQQTSTQAQPRQILQAVPGQINEEDMEVYSNLPGERAHASVSQMQELTSLVALKLPKNKDKIRSLYPVYRGLWAHKSPGVGLATTQTTANPQTIQTHRRRLPQLERLHKCLARCKRKPT